MILNKIFFIAKRKIFENFIFRFYKKKNIFKKIYKHNYWGSNESLSGPGSEIQVAENLISKLPQIIKKYNIKSIFDAPCGDLNWISSLLKKNIIQNYLGADIVDDLIKENSKKNLSVNCSFKIFDITNEKFPDYDLWICRDILYHFNFEDIFETLKNFINSNIKYILVTNTIVEKLHVNKDILTGNYRDLSLYHAPFNFDEKPLERILDLKHEEYNEEMCLWTKDQIKKFLEKK